MSKALLGLAAEGYLEKVEIGKYRAAGMAELGQAEFLKAFARASRVDSTRQRDLSEIARLKQNNDTMRQRLLDGDRRARSLPRGAQEARDRSRARPAPAAPRRRAGAAPPPAAAPRRRAAAAAAVRRRRRPGPQGLAVPSPASADARRRGRATPGGHATRVRVPTDRARRGLRRAAAACASR